MLQKFFKKAFALKGVKFTDEKIDKITNEFEGLLVLKIMAESGKKILPADLKKIREYSKARNYQQWILLIKSKYSESEWNALVKRHMAVLLGDYLTKVVGFRI